MNDAKELIPKINLNLVNYYIRKQETQESVQPAQDSTQQTAPPEPTAASTQETTPPEPSTDSTKETTPPDLAAASTPALSSLAHCQVNSVDLPAESQAPTIADEQDHDETDSDDGIKS